MQSKLNSSGGYAAAEPQLDPVALSHTANNVAIVLRDEFSLLELGLVVEVFQRANRSSESEARGPGAFSVALFSMSGGLIASSSSVSVETAIWSESLSGCFDTVLVIAGDNAPVAADSFAVIAGLKLAPNLSLVRSNDIGEWFVNAMGRSSSALSAAIGKTAKADVQPLENLSRNHAPVAGECPDSPPATVLSLVKADLPKQGAHAHGRRVPSPQGGLFDAREYMSSVAEVTDPIHIAIQWLHQNSSRSISIAQVAEVARMSERNFLRRFKLETSMTPSEYLMNARFEMSCSLLKETSLPVDKIARRTGMGSGERLSRVFKRRLSQTPTEYRAAWKNTARGGNGVNVLSCQL
jgi:transcriptional regulator GlxA family with amidase domain